MTKPVCNLDEFFLTRLHVDWREPDKSTKLLQKYTFDYDVGRNPKKPHRYRLAFRMAIGPDKGPPVGYLLETEIVGFFTFPEETVEERMQQLIRLNGCTILYGILRGHIATITGAFPTGKIVLPTFMMGDIVMDVEKRRLAARTAKPGTVDRQSAGMRTKRLKKK